MDVRWHKEGGALQLPIRFDDFPATGHRKLPEWTMLAKRLLDICYALLALLLLLPLLFPVVALIIKLEDGGPVLFAQQRVGYRQKIFRCLKFRTMVHYTGQDGVHIQRVTRAGALLRSTGLDELPQLFNVLRGDMSIVGPRPYSVQDHEQFSQVDHFGRRYCVRPGITGLAQSKGYKGQVNHEQEITERTLIDLMYIAQHTLASDLAIMYRSAVFLLAELYRQLWKRPS